jgi:elongation factor 4
MEVFHQRLEQEFGASVIATAPTVPYRCTFSDGTIKMIDNPAEYPEAKLSREIIFEEPMVKATIVAPQTYLGALLELCGAVRGEQTELTYLNTTSILLKYRFPLNEIVSDFYSQVKSVTAGFASFDYEEDGYQESDIIKMDILINAKPVDALTVMCHRSRAEHIGRKMCHNLKEVIDRTNFEIIIQARMGHKTFVARERLAPYRKDVLIKSGKTVGGGDITRKKKLLEKQKEGKKRMKMVRLVYRTYAHGIGPTR